MQNTRHKPQNLKANTSKPSLLKQQKIEKLTTICIWRLSGPLNWTLVTNIGCLLWLQRSHPKLVVANRARLKLVYILKKKGPLAREQTRVATSTECKIYISFQKARQSRVKISFAEDESCLANCNNLLHLNTISARSLRDAPVWNVVFEWVSRLLHVSACLVETLFLMETVTLIMCYMIEIAEKHEPIKEPRFLKNPKGKSTNKQKHRAGRSSLWRHHVPGQP